MKQKSRDFLSVLMITAMTLSIISGTLFVTEAAVGTLSKNTGTRHTVAAALSNQAKKYYNGNGIISIEDATSIQKYIVRIIS